MRHFFLLCRMRTLIAIAGLLMACTAHVFAHEVQHELSRGQGTTTVKLSYADGEPFSFERYEIFADGNPTPAQTGRTDEKGQVLIQGHAEKEWRLRAFTVDGHGTEVRFDVRASGGGGLFAAAASDRYVRMLAGVSVILALFGALRLFLRNKRSGGRPLVS